MNIANPAAPTAAYNPQVAVAVAGAGVKSKVLAGVITTESDTASRLISLTAEEDEFERTARETVPPNETGANIDLHA
ncbi:MAG: hypothetical protein P4L33_06590 [Capsulimonadaceae bacterium]|nr:hypothetical protein [Capsulimonadaceae bacterium]